MNDWANVFRDVPEWAGAALVGAVIAAAGYVAKLILDSLAAWRRHRAARRAALYRVASLLQAARVLYLVQARHRNDLAARLRPAYPDRKFAGYEDVFAYAYDDFTPEEAELHSIIRGITEHGMHPVNAAIRAWLDADQEFRTSRLWRRDFARLLNELDAHLLLWNAKYHAWIPGQPMHALVYLDDERKHGLGFPNGINAHVDRVLGPLKPEAPKHASPARRPPPGRPPAGVEARGEDARPMFAGSAPEAPEPEQPPFAGSNSGAPEPADGAAAEPLYIIADPVDQAAAVDAGDEPPGGPAGGETGGSATNEYKNG